MSAFQYDDSTKTGAKSEKWKSAHVCIIAMIIHPSMKWGEQRKTLLLTKLLYNFTLKKKLFKTFCCLWWCKHLGVFSGPPWARQMAHVKWKTALPRLPGYVHRRLSDFRSWLSSKKKGKSPVPGKKKKMQPTSGHAFQSIQVFTASPPGSFLQDPSPPRSSV